MHTVSFQNKDDREFFVMVTNMPIEEIAKDAWEKGIIGDGCSAIVFDANESVEAVIYSNEIYYV